MWHVNMAGIGSSATVRRGCERGMKIMAGSTKIKVLKTIHFSVVNKH